MRRLIAAEFGKLTSTRLWLGLLIASVAVTLLFAALAIAFGDDPGNPTPPLSSPGASGRCSPSVSAGRARSRLFSVPSG